MGARDDVLAFALTFPGAWLDHPWDEDVVKVGKKIVVFCGIPDREPPIVGMKLAESHEDALAMHGVTKTTYGLGKSGWVTVELTTGHPPVEVLLDWAEESYRLIAAKKLIKELDARG
ncbi:MAG: dGTPase [Frankiales bacterium]|nr:dGTPase [Frankiales bacterium]